MRVIDAGHIYELDQLDRRDETQPAVLRFVKRIGLKYPGNGDLAWPGPTTQEVLRALIDRTEYVNAQREHAANANAIAGMRSALVALEVRAATERRAPGVAVEIQNMSSPEREPTCAGCGHLLCSRETCR